VLKVWIRGEIVTRKRHEIFIFKETTDQMNPVTNEPATTYPLETAIRAFNQHLPITVKFPDGKHVGPGHIIIMYGDVAFRMQEEKSQESHFIRIADVDEIVK
jgi:hypothetical protein